MRANTQQMQRFWPACDVSKLLNTPHSLKNSLFAGNLAGDGCDWHCVSSQPFQRSTRLHGKRAKVPEIRAFRAIDFVSGLPVRQSRAGNQRVSPALSARIPVSRRPAAETRSIRTAARGTQRRAGVVPGKLDHLEIIQYLRVPLRNLQARSVLLSLTAGERAICEQAGPRALIRSVLR